MDINQFKERAEKQQGSITSIFDKYRNANGKLNPRRYYKRNISLKPKQDIDNDESNELNGDGSYKRKSEGANINSYFGKEGQSVDFKKLYQPQEEKDLTKFFTIVHPNIQNFTVYMPYKPYSYQSETVIELTEAITKQEKLVMFESPTGTGKTQTILSSVLSIMQLERTKINPSIKTKPKLLYFTRTVSQMTQVLDEIKKCGYKVKSNILSSRSHLCLYSKVNTLKSNSEMNQACFDAQKHKECPYKVLPPHIGGERPLFDNILDIEDLKVLGEATKNCAYYFSKDMAKHSDVIVMSYKYLVDPLFRKNIKDYIPNSFIVFDEAHNLCKVLEEAGSWELGINELENVVIDTEQLSAAIHGATDAAIRRHSFITDVLDKLLIFIEKIVKNIIEESKKERLSVSSQNNFIPGTAIVRLFNLELLMDLYPRFNDILVSLADIQWRSPLEKFILICISLCKLNKLDPKHFESYKIHIAEDKRFSFFCLDPSIEFNQIQEFAPRSIILASGTLKPFDLLEKQLNTSFPIKINKIPDMDIWKRKLATIKLEHYFHHNDNKPILLNYKNRAENENIKGFLKLLAEISQTVPAGILVFLPTYSLLYEYKTALEQNPLISSQLNKSKVTYFENKHHNYKQQFNQYCKSCRTTGAVFFLVFNGKFSEGMDFKHEYARMVILMGIPFPNLMDLKIQAKKLFLEDTYKKSKEKVTLGILSQFTNTKEAVNFHEWYVNEAMIAVNQAAGRIKRNEDDYGSVLFVDSRYNQKKFSNHISDHLKQTSVNITESLQLNAFLKQFYVQNLKTEPVSKFEEMESKGLQEMFDEAAKLDEELGREKFFECVICYDKSSDSEKFRKANCGHIACEDCWKKSLSYKLECMMCKTRTRVKQLKSIN